MPKWLIPVDGSEKSLRAVRFTIDCVKTNTESVSVYLLNVQLPVTFGDIRKYVSEEAIRTYYREEGEKALASAKTMMDEAGITHAGLVEVGQVAEMIDKRARELQCDQIIMATRGLGSISSLILGSVATKVIQLAELPITLVK